MVGPRLRLVSYNLHSQRDDPAAMVELVRSLSPDVLVLQEAPRRFRWRQKCAELARRFGLVYAAGGLPSLGNLILTDLRVRVDRTWCVRFPLTPGRHLRGVAFAGCAVARVPFVVAGSHLSLDPVERLAQAGRLRQELGAVDSPVLLGGDVNDRPDTPAWKTLTDGLVDAAPTGGPTFPAAGPRARIDGIFVDPRVTVASCDAVDTPVARRASDHLPVLAELVLPPA